MGLGCSPDAVAPHCIANLCRVDYASVVSLNLPEGLCDGLVLDAAAGVLDEDGPEAQLEGVEGRGGCNGRVVSEEENVGGGGG